MGCFLVTDRKISQVFTALFSPPFVKSSNRVTEEVPNCLITKSVTRLLKKKSKR